MHVSKPRKTSAYGTGEVPCEECRRLKIKCSRTGPPCEQCIRRSVEDICPDGKLVTGRQGRYVLTSTEALHKENKDLRLRIKALEEALQAETAGNDAPHPLLDPQLLTIARPYLKDGPEGANILPKDLKSRTDSESIVKLFGTMHVDDGKDKYLGSTALSETHLNIHDNDDDFEPEIESHAQLAIPFSLVFPPQTYLQMAVNNLPPKVEAWTLVETYYQHATYVSHIIPRHDFVQRIFTPCYGGDISLISPYRLAALFSLLAVGALHDLTRPIYCPASREWMEIVQSLLFGTFGSFEASIESIEAVALACAIFPCRPELELSKTYFQLAWCMKMAQSGLQYGRPMTMNSRFTSQGSVSLGDDNNAKFKRLMVPLMEDIAELLIAPGSASNYAEALKIDRRIREVKASATRPPSEIGFDTTEADLPEFMRLVWCYSNLLTLHRPYFALAVTKSSPENPSGGKLAPSIAACYDAASSLTHLAMRFVGQNPGLLARMGPVWPHLFTSMVVLYSFGIHMPFWMNTAQALNTADMCLVLVYSPSLECVRAKATMPYLLGLQEKARTSFLLFSDNMPRNPSSEFDTLIPGLATGIAVRTVRAEDNPRETPRPLKPLSERGARGITRNLVRNLMFMENNRGQDSLFAPDIPVEPNLNSLQLQPMDPILGTTSTMPLDWNWNWDASISTSDSTPEKISQLELDNSWLAFLSQL
ncbi:SubName: Full=Uncharacterized protein {ECO:0000313/EMBL:CCA69401.1} [Serendipita indica DSM 11827]|nr:SubName: Full=Uncharacterized protein {ECO:0000313/EMBL:CCA69401.1} [Serendipita indica DSM 11827]